MSRKLCLTCKGGRLLCGLDHCPLLAKVKLQKPSEIKLKQEMDGPSPSIFVGWNGYPNVNVGPMLSLEQDNSFILDDPSKWYGLGFDDIILLRSLMVRSKERVGVRDRTRFVDENQELALSIKPLDVETVFRKTPKYSMVFNPISQPMGPTAELDKLKITENPRIPRKVDYVVSDDLPASSMATKLFDSDFDVYYLTRVFSSGALGRDQSKRLVPTRWSITAVDDILGKELMKRIRTFPELSDITVFENTYLENHFEVLCIPGGWEFEQFESWAPQTLWTMAQDEPVIVAENEGHGGRWDYALNEGGGYYAGRFAVAEALASMKKQARVVVFREIYDSYIMPVGVWEVRENVRKAMQNPARKFSTLKEALLDINTRLRIPIRKYLEKSEILRQRRITDYN